MGPREGRRNRQADVERIEQVLVGLSYPAARWQVIAEADHYGADSVTRAQLLTLPVRSYPDITDVLAALGLLLANRRWRAVSRPPAAGQRSR